VGVGVTGCAALVEGATEGATGATGDDGAVGDDGPVGDDVAVGAVGVTGAGVFCPVGEGVRRWRTWSQPADMTAVMSPRPKKRPRNVGRRGEVMVNASENLRGALPWRIEPLSEGCPRRPAA
jgi:hypothetical protein